MEYNTLEKHFTAPNKTSYSFNYKRIPRKLKKKNKKILNGRYEFLDMNQKLWFILGITNPNYKKFLIKQIIK